MVRPLAAGTFLLVMTSAFGPPTALAGPVEELVQLAVNPADPDMLVLRYEYSGDGLLYSKDGGRTFKFVCGSSVSDPSTDAGALQKLGPIAVGGDDKVLLGVFGGLWIDDGKGCSWARDNDMIDRWVTDIVAHPSDPQIAFLITSNGGEAENGITRRNADGSLTPLGTMKAMLISRLRVVELPGGGLRFYESGVLGQIPVTDDAGVMGTKPNYVIRVSDDEGETWVEHALGVLDGAVRLEAVDPTNPDRIVVNVSRDRDTVVNVPLLDSVLVSENQGESFEEWATVTKFGGITFSPEGEVWLGDGGDTSTPDALRGILHAASLADAPTVLTDAFPVNCLQYAGDDLFVCQRFQFGRLSKDDAVFTASLELPKLEAMNECEGVDTAAVCRQQLCTGYCGLGHFATAPMCVAAYDSNEDRGCAPAAVGGAGGAGGADGGAGTGTGGTGGGAGTATGGAGGAGGTDGELDAGVAGAAADDDEDSGCSCTAIGAHRSSSAGYWLLSLFAVVLPFVRKRAWIRGRTR